MIDLVDYISVIDYDGLRKHGLVATVSDVVLAPQIIKVLEFWSLVAPIETGLVASSRESTGLGIKQRVLTTHHGVSTLHEAVCSYCVLLELLISCLLKELHLFLEG